VIGRLRTDTLLCHLLRSGLNIIIFFLWDRRAKR